MNFVKPVNSPPTIDQSIVIQLFLFMDKNDIAISSRITDFNVEISAVNIHYHFSQMFGQNYKFNLSLCYFS